MTKMRSPNFPMIPLPQAIGLVDKIFREDRTNSLEKEVAARHMGYSGLTGRTLKLMGALSQYGLLDKIGKGQVRVSKTAVSILHWADEAEKREAIAKAGTSPALFRRIRDAFPEGASDRTLTSYLVKEGFTDSAIPAVLKGYKETNHFLAENGVSESYGRGVAERSESSDFEDDEDDMTEQPPALDERMMQRAARALAPRAETAFTTLALDFNLSSAGLAVTGRTNSSQELNAFIDKLKALAVLLPETQPTDEDDGLAGL